MKTKQLSSHDIPGCVYLALKALQKTDPAAASEFERWLCLICTYDIVAEESGVK